MDTLQFYFQSQVREIQWIMKVGIFSRAIHFVPMSAHLVYMGAQCRPNGRPWAQNVWL